MPPPRATSAEDKALVQLLTTEVTDRSAETNSTLKDIHSQIFTAWDSENFGALEAMANDYRTSKRRMPGGIWYLEEYYNVLEGLVSPQKPKDDDDFVAIEERVARWLKAYPNSPAAIITFTKALESHGWYWRGGGMANDVKPENMARFDMFIAKAAQFLFTHEGASVDPQWYTEAMEIAKAQGWDKAHTYALLEAAATKEPYYYATYDVARERFLPKWGGTYAQVEELARFVLAKTKANDGKSGYARFYMGMACCKQHLSGAKYGGMVWKDAEAGFIDLVKRNPDKHTLNRFAQFSCALREATAARLLLDYINNNYDMTAWQDDEFSYPVNCVSWLKNLDVVENGPMLPDQTGEDFFNNTLKLAKSGDALAQLQISRAYEFGMDVKPDKDKWFEWALKAAQGGNVDAQRQTGFIYEYYRADFERAKVWYYNAAQQGDKYSQAALGAILFDDSNYSDAAKWYTKAIADLTPRKMHNDQILGVAASHLGMLYVMGKDPIKKDTDKGLEILRYAANNGSTSATSALGWLFINGEYVSRNYGQGYYWLALSEKLGGRRSEEAMNEAMSALGAGERADIDQKVEEKLKLVLYVPNPEADNATIPVNISSRANIEANLKLAEEGDAKAQFQASSDLSSDWPWGQKADLVKAHEYLLKSAEQGFIPAQDALGYYYQFQKPDMNLAVQWYYKAAQQNDGAAQMQLGTIALSSGDTAGALKWYEFAVKNCPEQRFFVDGPFGGGGESYTRLGGLLIQAPAGVTKDVKRGMQLLQFSASRGSASAMYMLSTLYVQGKDIPLDYKRSYFWSMVLTTLGMPVNNEALAKASGKLPQSQRNLIDLKVKQQVPKPHVFLFPKDKPVNISF